MKSSSELVERKEIKNTPFEIVGNPEQGYFLALGRFRLTNPEKTKDEVLIKLRQDRWNIITTMIATIADTMITNHENEKHKQ